MTHRQAAQLAFEVLGRRPRILSVPSVILRAGLVPVRALSPGAADTLGFLLAGLTEDTVAPPTGPRALREHFEEEERAR